MANGQALKFYHFTKIGGIGDAMTERYAQDGTEVFEIVNWYKRSTACQRLCAGECLAMALRPVSTTPSRSPRGAAAMAGRGRICRPCTMIRSQAGAIASCPGCSASSRRRSLETFCANLRGLHYGAVFCDGGCRLRRQSSGGGPA